MLLQLIDNWKHKTFKLLRGWIEIYHGLNSVITKEMEPNLSWKDRLPDQSLLLHTGRSSLEVPYLTWISQYERAPCVKPVKMAWPSSCSFQSPFGIILFGCLIIYITGLLNSFYEFNDLCSVDWKVKLYENCENNPIIVR